MWLLPGGYSPEHLCQLGHAMRNEADGLDVRQVLSLSAEQLERRGSRISRIPIRRTPRRTRRTFIFGTALSPVQRLQEGLNVLIFPPAVKEPKLKHYPSLKREA